MITKNNLKELVENTLRVALIKSRLLHVVIKNDFRRINIYNDGSIDATFFGHYGAEDDEIDIDIEDLYKSDKQLNQEVEKELQEKEEEIEKNIEKRKKIDEELEYKKFLELKSKFEKGEKK